MFLTSRDRLGTDVLASVQAEARRSGVVNVPVLAEDIRTRHCDENIAREDIEEMVLQTALQRGCVIEFNSMAGTDAFSIGYALFEIELKEERRDA